MKIAMDMLSRTFSRALDIIEEEQIGASDRHSMRVSALCTAMGKHLHYNDDALSALAVCALFHDNALTEYNLSEKKGEQIGHNMVLHCEKGQSNVKWLPFKKNIEGFILYHHEKGNGCGPFRRKEGEFPNEAALLAAADSIDVAHRLQHVLPENLPELKKKLERNAETYSTRSAMNVFLEVLDEYMLESLRDDTIAKTLDKNLPRWEVDLKESSVIGIAGFAAHVIDCKSKFTRKHTSQIAGRAWLMGMYYGYEYEQRSALYLAASLHDIGKIAIPIAILEKPAELDADDFKIIKEHVRYTHDWLSEVPDFADIKNWAANHHEKLNGQGYPYGKKDYEIDFNSRLVACLDIYQAVCEQRPYHNARSHAETMPVLYKMAGKGFIDSRIVNDIDEVMEEYSMRDVPSPLNSEEYNHEML